MSIVSSLLEKFGFKDKGQSFYDISEAVKFVNIVTLYKILY